MIKPKHIAIVLDGNRRYAKKQNIPLLMGHKAGLKKVSEFLEWCKEFNVKQATLYSFSTENFRRAKKEVMFLMKLFREQLRRLRNDKRLMNYGIRVRFIGNLDLFDKIIRNSMEDIMNYTKKNKKFYLNFAIGYGSRQEIVNATKKICNMVKNNKLNIDKINEKSITKKLYFKDDVDFFIRPGGEKRLSNFLLWQSSYAELYFSDKLWPEFTKNDFKKALEDYSKRERRFGV